MSSFSSKLHQITSGQQIPESNVSESIDMVITRVYKLLDARSLWYGERVSSVLVDDFTEDKKGVDRVEYVHEVQKKIHGVLTQYPEFMYDLSTRATGRIDISIKRRKNP